MKPLESYENRLPNLATWAKAKEELPEARVKKATATERIAALDTEITAKQDQVQVFDDERCDLLIQSTEAEVLGKDVNSLTETIKSLREAQGDLHIKSGGLKAQLAALQKDEEERQAGIRRDRANSQVPDLTRWQTLIKAFGRDGIPALIIENAVPELERISGEILGQMTNGQQSIRFETQKELKSKAGLADTLDIWVDIWDEPEARIYESFSGGEQLRIDFALRFALAELLARRAGAKIEWLTVDEGLGSQDAGHRDLVLEAIKKVSDRFKKTFVITHIEAAQAVFEQQIYLEKKDGRVEVKVA